MALTPVRLHHFDPAWCDRWMQRAWQAMNSHRIPLVWAGAVVGSVAPALLQSLQARSAGAASVGWREIAGVSGTTLHLPDDPEHSFVQIREALHGKVAFARPTERLPLFDSAGQVLGSVPRDLARVLGVSTHSVHLVGWTDDGCWVQERSLHKQEDPGLLDTLMGGTMAWGETVQSTLERELHEEAGLHSSQLQQLMPCGQVLIRRPCEPPDHGAFHVETVHCWSARVASGLTPTNLDGEVSAFHHLNTDELTHALHDDRFSLAAAGVMLRVLSPLLVPPHSANTLPGP